MLAKLFKTKSNNKRFKEIMKINKSILTPRMPTDEEISEMMQMDEYEAYDREGNVLDFSAPVMEFGQLEDDFDYGTLFGDLDEAL